VNEKLTRKWTSALGRNWFCGSRGRRRWPGGCRCSHSSFGLLVIAPRREQNQETSKCHNQRRTELPPSFDPHNALSLTSSRSRAASARHSTPACHLRGAQALWKLSQLPVPTRTMWRDCSGCLTQNLAWASDKGSRSPPARLSQRETGGTHGLAARRQPFRGGTSRIS